MFLKSSFQGLNLGLDFDENLLHNLISELCGEFLLLPDALCSLMVDTKPLGPIHTAGFRMRLRFSMVNGGMP